MSKELFVSSTPHETKVGVVEDDLLAEIYLERENEYTLAGSIYKGRVTRVLPGMQSAFVDIGLERDAFLYVSDFMELAEAEEVDEIPTNRSFQESGDSEHQREPHYAAETRPGIADFNANEKLADDSRLTNAPTPAGENAASQERNDQGEKDTRGGFRGRRRRRGRRGERMPDSKFARPGSEGSASEHPASDSVEAPRPEKGPERSSERSSERTQHPQRSDYGPPAGYQPIILPGESISKYRGLAHAQPPARQQLSTQNSARSQSENPFPAIAKTFPEDEPLFVESASVLDSNETRAFSPSASVAEIPIEPPSTDSTETTLDIASLRMGS